MNFIFILLQKGLILTLRGKFINSSLSYNNMHNILRWHSLIGQSKMTSHSLPNVTVTPKHVVHIVVQSAVLMAYVYPQAL